uniref:Histidine triad nucleotide binding protein 2 n=1 Tax=Cyclopterus lumpus TaxID=8103 RepID=A0A8C2WAT6_CYCLU
MRESFSSTGESHIFLTCSSTCRNRADLLLAVREATTEGYAGDEVRLAEEASRKYGSPTPTIFSKVIDKSIPADIIYEDEKCLAFRDISPQAPVHFLVIPRVPIPRISEARDDDAEVNLAIYFLILADPFQGIFLSSAVINDGKHGSQSVYHLHVHVLGGRQMAWPPG